MVWWDAQPVRDVLALEPGDERSEVAASRVAADEPFFETRLIQISQRDALGV